MNRVREPGVRNAPRMLALALGASTLLAACGAPDANGPEAAATAAPAANETARDIHSLANIDDFRVEHLALDLDVDFDTHRLVGTADLTLARLDPRARELVLDSRALDVRSVALLADDATTPLEFEVGATQGSLGEPIVVSVPADTGDSLVVRIEYATSPDATGLQWVAPEQTAGGRHPFLYSQSQAIHARSWVPLQDSPQVRFTYEAVVRVPPELRALMSADNDPAHSADGVYRFEMPQRIPSYLLAIAAGELEFRELGPRTGVYAEPAVIEAAAAEFADTERMIEAGERLYGPYRWGRYDLLILPPSFPFGGMENPRLSFITPTVIAGDRSLVSLIAHELAHSWSGNLVTNATWRDFWLNEGFTVLLERRIMRELYGERRAAMEDLLGYQTLQDDLATLAPGDQILAIDLGGRNPDDGMTEIPYEKGRLLLGWLESRVGAEAFDTYLRGYFDRFAFKSITTEQFRADLEEHLLAKHPQAVTAAELDEWLHEPGLPASAIRPQSDALERVDALIDGFVAGSVTAKALPGDDWSTHEWLHFLNNLPLGLERERLAALDEAWSLTQEQNAEIAHAWLLIAVRNDYSPAWPRLEEYLVSIGRRKLIVPLYSELMQSPEGARRARAIYERARPGYQAIATRTLDAIVEPQGG